MAATIERMEKFLTEQNPTNTMKEREFSERRNKKKRRRREINADRILIYFRYMYILAALGLVSGTVLVLGSTVKTVSEGTFLWSQRHIFTIIGPVLIGLGIVFLLIGTGLATWRENVVKLQKQDEESMSRGSSVRSYDTVDGGGCVKTKKKSHKYKKLKHDAVNGTNHSIKCNGYLKDQFSFECQSISEKSDFEDTNESFTDVWVKRANFCKSVTEHKGKPSRQSVNSHNKIPDICHSVDNHRRNQSVIDHEKSNSVNVHRKSHSVKEHKKNHLVHGHTRSHSISDHSAHDQRRSHSVKNHSQSSDISHRRTNSIKNPHGSDLHDSENKRERANFHKMVGNEDVIICGLCHNIIHLQGSNFENQNFARINKNQKVNVSTNLNFQSGLDSVRESNPPSLNSSINSNKVIFQAYME